MWVVRAAGLWIVSLARAQFSSHNSNQRYHPPGDASLAYGKISLHRDCSFSAVLRAHPLFVERAVRARDGSRFRLTCTLHAAGSARSSSDLQSLAGGVFATAWRNKQRSAEIHRSFAPRPDIDLSLTRFC
ncbi:hypothetical protein MRX96_041334 [Rhipicephalus microplus]